MNKNKISFYNVIKTISDSIDLMSEEISGHHKLVAYVSLKIGLELKLEKTQLRKLVFSSLIHDIGILYFDEKIDDILRNRTNAEHAYVGYALLDNHFPFEGYSEVLKNHHWDWSKMESNKLNYLSNIINLADITAHFMDRREKNILANTNSIIKKIEDYSVNRINSRLLDVFKVLSVKESFWLDAINVKKREKIIEKYVGDNLDIELNLNQLLSISEIVSHIIDFRSPFTANHSKGAATVSAEIAKDIGFAKEEIKIMKIAGYFHDIGKMSWPINILNKKGQLTKKEWALVKTHSYYSFNVLENISEIPELKEWAGYHHETLDGKGYPFKLSEKELSIGAKIMSIADIFTALGENRPYRNGYKKKKIIDILSVKALDNKLDQEIVGLVIDNFDSYNLIRNEEQEKTINEYEFFKEKTFDEIENIYFNSA